MSRIRHIASSLILFAIPLERIATVEFPKFAEEKFQSGSVNENVIVIGQEDPGEQLGTVFVQ